MFPEGLFYILSRKHGFALDVYDGQVTEGSYLIVWPQKFEDSDNQLWTYENGRLVNKKSGHVMDISSSAFKKDKTIVQKKSKPNKQSQEWIYDQGFICSKEYPSLVLDIKGDSPKGGAQVLLYKRKDTDNLNQLWQFEPYQLFESSLDLVTTTLPLHKKETFGQPRLGYAAEVGIPPELKAIPENNKIAGVGKNASATPTSNAPVDNSRIDPSLAQYGSFYGGSSTAPPAAQPGQQPSAHNYPPPPGPPPTQSSNNSYPPPPAQAGPTPSTNIYPPPPGPPPANNAAGYPSPSPGYAQPNSPTYPPAQSSGYPVQPPSPSNYQQQANNVYPPAPSGYSQPVSTGYPPSNTNTGYPPAPPSPSNYLNNNNGYPPAPNNGGYPGSPPLVNTGYPASPNQLSTSPPGYPSAYPPANTGYPPSPSNPTGNFYQQQQQQQQPGHENYGYNAPPPLPNNRPQDQYGYPSYPQ
ncbi:hypothetical protein BDF21DRAFT_423145 [Thamnidium elegans]|nr:hypothetical protein BDF21DRAFT_423145 [Thamnidium elegans]